MDPISMIITALAAGASASLKESAAEAVTSAYSGLKALIRRKLRGDPVAEETLERYEQQPGTDEDLLKQRLEQAGADRDEEVVRAAQELMRRVDPDGASAGKYNVTITGGKGNVVGDNATVTMNFDEG